MLTSQLVYPVSFHVPRKTYYDFHADLYPDIRSPNSKLTREQFFDLSSATQQPESKMSLDPKTNSFLKLLRFSCDIGAKVVLSSPTSSPPNDNKKSSFDGQLSKSNSQNDATPSASSSSKMISQESFDSNFSTNDSSDAISTTSNDSKPKPALKPKPKPKPEIMKKFAGMSF